MLYSLLSTSTTASFKLPKSLSATFADAPPSNFKVTFVAFSSIVTTSPVFSVEITVLAVANSVIAVVSKLSPFTIKLFPSIATFPEFSFPASATVSTVRFSIIGNVLISSLYSDSTSFPSTVATNLNAYVFNDVKPSIVIWLFSLIATSFVVFNVYLASV